MSDTRQVSIRVPVLARVEGEGALTLEIADEKIRHLQLEIFEPPRYFEKFLEGREPQQVIDTVARICGICPVAYQISAVQALESIFSVNVSKNVRAMRRVFYCGEWLQSHSLHIHLLAAPDFLGFSNAIEMAAEYPDVVRRGLMLQNLGNDLIRLFGARSVHPIGVKVGGFFKAPEHTEISDLLNRLQTALPEAEELIKWTASLPLPDDPQNFTSVALRSPYEYAICEGLIHSSNGLEIPIEAYEEHFAESHEAHSTALYSHLDGQPYLVGPLARLNINLDMLPPAALRLLESTGIAFPSNNMFHSIVARAVEIYLAITESIRLLQRHVSDSELNTDFQPTAGIGFGCSEAPRGLLWHRYELDDEGQVLSARIVPPTSQNQARIEEDLTQSLMQYGLHHNDNELRLRSEMVIRNYDPCISCATHFLRLKVKR